MSVVYYVKRGHFLEDFLGKPVEKHPKEEFIFYQQQNYLMNESAIVLAPLQNDKLWTNFFTDYVRALTLYKVILIINKYHFAYLSLFEPRSHAAVAHMSYYTYEITFFSPSTRVCP